MGCGTSNSAQTDDKERPPKNDRPSRNEEMGQNEDNNEQFGGGKGGRGGPQEGQGFGGQSRGGHGGGQPHGGQGFGGQSHGGMQQGPGGKKERNNQGGQEWKNININNLNN